MDKAKEIKKQYIHYFQNGNICTIDIYFDIRKQKLDAKANWKNYPNVNEWKIIREEYFLWEQHVSDDFNLEIAECNKIDLCAAAAKTIAKFYQKKSKESGK